MNKFVSVFALVALATASSVSFAQNAGRTQSRQSRLFSETSIEKGWERASQQQQPMLVMFTSDHCMYCKKMLTETYGHPAIRRMLAGKTQTVLAHADDYQELIKKLGIRGYPSSVLISPQGDVLDFMQGFVPPKKFAQRVSPLLKDSQTAQASAATGPQQTVGR